jgi:hypothetical protein
VDLAHAAWNGSGAALHQRFVGLAHKVLIRRSISAWFKDERQPGEECGQHSMIDYRALRIAQVHFRCCKPR